MSWNVKFIYPFQNGGQIFLTYFKTITAKRPERPIETTHNYSTYINY